MRIVFDRNLKILRGEDFEITATCIVRNEINGWRSLGDPGQVVRTMGTVQQPYMPRPFPSGIWDVMKPQPRTDEYKRPFFIPTSATRTVELWELDSAGGYERRTDVQIIDAGYGIHFSADSSTTLGCIRISSEADLLMLVSRINTALKSSEPVTLEVI